MVESPFNKAAGIPILKNIFERLFLKFPQKKGQKENEKWKKGSSFDIASNNAKI